MIIINCYLSILYFPNCPRVTSHCGR